MSGIGITIPEEDPVETPAVRQAGASEPEVERLFGKTYETTPSVASQLELYPETTKRGPVVCQCYKVHDPVERDHFNQLLQDMYPKSAPKSVLIRMREEFHEGGFSVFVLYQNIFYKKLLDSNLGRTESNNE